MTRMHKTIDEIEAKLMADLENLVGKETLNSIFAMPMKEFDIAVGDLDLPPPDFDIDYSSPAAPAEDEPRAAATTSSGKTVRVSIRLPIAVIDAFKARAITERKGYQTLIVRALREHLGRR